MYAPIERCAAVNPERRTSIEVGMGGMPRSAVCSGQLLDRLVIGGQKENETRTAAGETGIDTCPLLYNGSNPIIGGCHHRASRPYAMARTATTAAAAAPARRTVGRPSKSAIKKETIVAASLEQIDKVGVYAFSLRDVARSLGVYPATIYWHVNSKDALLADVAGAVMQEVTPP